ncbi:MAG: hybrid sensor histidine kinase/response regulator [Bacteroidales bacterium]|nr:hybrid sensor histidine kinase/response regulator [Bacteroidales bacterium]
MEPNLSSDKSGLKVLVVDDNDSNIATLKGLLKYEGYTILTATNGAMALELAESASPDLILLDIKMPVMDGFEVCRRLKSSKETFQIPIIFLTVLSQTSDIVKGLEMGAEDYVSKPFKPAELLARVRVHLQLKAVKDELKQNNLMLEDKNDQLSLLNATKDKLLSIISHDLRAPMGTLKEILNFIMSNYDDLDHQKLHESLESIRDSIESSYTLVENLLFWARNQRGDILYEPQMQHVKKIVDDSIKLMRASAAAKNIQLTSEIMNDGPAYFDSNMLSVVMRNLTNNAIKFTREGGHVTINVDSFEEDPENTILVEVRDSGVGMRSEDAREIFNDGTSFSSAGAVLGQGSGLGLKLCREFVERNGGKIWAESTLGEGSIFRFTLSKKEHENAA